MPPADSPNSNTVSRFAHPSVLSRLHGMFDFAADHAQQALDFISGRLQKVPPTRGNGVMTLGQMIGDAAAADISASSRICIHAVGDTGRGKDSPQGDVALAMAADYD